MKWLWKHHIYKRYDLSNTPAPNTIHSYIISKDPFLKRFKRLGRQLRNICHEKTIIFEDAKLPQIALKVS